ncbi:PilW family protein [Natronincola ferrireducens]|uniref:Prepilin-type N-terminal cleavage/methylation domain-containing protein n=1 Tax=Natronincola ferrireducens TaxID=393762 RepID=A0A1G9CK95_9FIRM|nr:type II secretion system protein [Natronincola ferrireducens]SDK51835.1 prepilin-type N-terminal cleavage/methylation domain-containing protein [Natronincola ferrireducens]
MNQYLHDNRGVTLIEIVVSITLISIVMMALTTIFIYSIGSYSRQVDEIAAKQKVQFALNYIEKRIRECDQYQITYHSNNQTIEGRDFEGKKVWIDLSGRRRNSFNTLLYFYRDRGELRVNKKNENNVLVDGIRDILVREIVEGELLEIEVIAHKIDYSVKLRLSLDYR